MFWLALALLHSPLVALYAAGLRLLASFMHKLRLHQAKVGCTGLHSHQGMLMSCLENPPETAFRALSS